MKPDKIYLPWEYAEIDVLPPGVTTKQVFGKDVCYIRKDALLEWAKGEQNKCSDETHPYAMFMNVVIDKLESI